MQDYNILKQRFDNYIHTTYDLKSVPLYRKFNHTYRVVDLSETIARSLNLSDRDIELSKIIGLLHDLGRFRQYEKYHTFQDSISIDHAFLGTNIINSLDLFNATELNETEQELIITAINNHNKYKIPETLNDRQKLFSNIIRDADKLDILNEASTVFYSTKQEQKEIENGIISKEIYAAIQDRRTAGKQAEKTPLDTVITFLAFVFDINYNISYKILKEQNYMNAIIDRFDFKEPKTKTEIEDIRKIVNDFIYAKLRKS